MTGLIDTHTHLYLPEFADDVNGDGTPDAVGRAVGAGVTHMIFPNVDLTTIQPMKRLAAAHPAHVSMAMGLHPTEVGDDWQEALHKIHDELLSGIYTAVGEVGIDLYWDASRRTQQMKAFDAQLSLAEERGLPVIIHCRNALDETLEVLQSHPAVSAVMHSFGGTAGDAERILQTGSYYFGINGILTFKKSTLPDAVKAIPTERLLLETDAPYLAPVPMRGRRNESAYLTHTASCLAEILGIDMQEVADLTSNNARRLFGIAAC
ncbi:TatD family deoxyribonuclease [Muribaculaceae bacterium Isolate-105 (HZI)]|nr:TatD family deoxyribonuclease [Muribaculaceae bacterium Isolate-105 (HZI)]